MTKKEILEKLYILNNQRKDVEFPDDFKLTFENLILKLESEISENKLKKQSSSIQISALKRILKMGKGEPCYRETQYSHIVKDEYGENKEVYMSPYCLVRLANPLDFLGSNEKLSFNINGIMKNAKNDKNQLELPNLIKLKAYVKNQKDKWKEKNKKTKDFCCFYDFGNNLPVVNAEFLINIMEALPEATAYSGNNYNYDFIYFTDGKGNDGVLIPVNRDKLRKKDRNLKGETSE